MIEQFTRGEEYSCSDYIEKYDRRYGNDVSDLPYINTLLLNASPDSKILDAGCGLGNYSQYLSLRGFNVESVDLSHGMLQRAKLQKPFHLQLRNMDIQHLGYQEEVFNYFIALFSLNHVPSVDIPMALDELNRTLQKGGEGLIAVPYGPADVVGIDFLYPDARVLLNFFFPKRLNTYLDEANFNVADQQVVDIDDYYTQTNKLIYTFVRKK